MVSVEEFPALRSNNRCDAAAPLRLPMSGRVCEETVGQVLAGNGTAARQRVVELDGVVLQNRVTNSLFVTTGQYCPQRQRALILILTQHLIPHNLVLSN